MDLPSTDWGELRVQQSHPTVPSHSPASLNCLGAHVSPQFWLEFGARPLSAVELWLRHKGSHHRRPQPSTAHKRRAGEHPSCAQRPAAHTQVPCISSAASSSPDTFQYLAGYLQERILQTICLCKIPCKIAGLCLCYSAQAKLCLLNYPVPISPACPASKPSLGMLLFISNPPQGDNLLALMLQLLLHSIPAAKGQITPQHRTGMAPSPIMNDLQTSQICLILPSLKSVFQA